MKSRNDNAEEREALRFSRLKLMSKSAAHYAAGYAEETGIMRKGSATHAYMLGQSHKVVVYDGGRRDDRIAAWRAFKETHVDKHILNPTELAEVAGMRASLERHERAMTLLSGVREETIQWYDGTRLCRGTPDSVHVRSDGTKILVELKTSETSHPEWFVRKCRRYHWHNQLAWYARGLELTEDYDPGPVTAHYIVAVESSAPYPVTVFRVGERSLEAGARQNRLWLEQLLVSEASGHYPAYTESDVLLEVVEDDAELEWEAA